MDRLDGEESKSEEQVEEVNIEDGENVCHVGQPNCSVIGRCCCFGLSSVSVQARASKEFQGGVAGTTSIWLSLFE